MGGCCSGDRSVLVPWVLASVAGPVVPLIPACPGYFSHALRKSLEVLAGACSRGACVLQHSRDLVESTKGDSQRLKSRIRSPSMLPPSDAQLQSAVLASKLQTGLKCKQSKSPQTLISRRELCSGTRPRGCLPARSPKASPLAWPGCCCWRARPPVRGWGSYQRAHD